MTKVGHGTLVRRSDGSVLLCNARFDVSVVPKVVAPPAKPLTAYDHPYGPKRPIPVDGKYGTKPAINKGSYGEPRSSYRPHKNYSSKVSSVPNPKYGK